MRLGGRILALLCGTAAAAALAPAAGAAEYISNGGFEGSTSGWFGYHATLGLVSPGYEGSSAVRVAWSTGSYYSLVTTTKPVSSTMAGVVYTASARVRSIRPGKTLCIKVREWSGSAQVGSGERCLVSTSGWQLLSVDYTARGTGDQLDMYLHQPSGVTSGDTFDADEVSLSDAAAPADTAPPETAIGAGPSGTTTATDATFSFSASESGSTFACRLDGGVWSTCVSPRAYSGLAAGSHTFDVRATDTAGNVDPTPATRTWTIEAAAPGTPPETVVDSAPADVERSGAATFAFHASEPGATFECRLDGAGWAACASPKTVYVENREHRFEVRAVGGAGADATPAAVDWWADALLPDGFFEGSGRGWQTSDSTAVAGWKGYSAAVAYTSDGIRGTGALAVTASGAGYSAYTSPKPVNVTVAGATYTVGGWLRTASAPGETLCLRIREWSGSSVVGSAQRCVTGETSWRQVADLAYTPAAPGSELEVDAYQATGAASGFELDGVTVTSSVPPRDPESTPTGSETLLAFGDAATCYSSGDEWIARLLDSLPGTIALLGDAEQDHGTADEYAGCYDPVFGRFRERTRPAIADHDYPNQAEGYFAYFGEAAGDPAEGYYSYELGSWKVIVLNGDCAQVGGCDASSPQGQWLRAELAGSSATCTLAYWHYPRFSSGTLHGSNPALNVFWEPLYDAGVDVVLNGHEHMYERFAPQDPSGAADPQHGIREFVVGTGGTSHYDYGPQIANSEVIQNTTYGVLELTLRSGGYDWRFVPQEGRSFTDGGSGSCHGAPGDSTAPSVALTSPADGATVSGTATLTADASDDTGVERVEFRVGGTLVGTDSTAPYAVEWDSTTVADGTVDVEARAVDAAGNAATSTRTVTVANATPAAPETQIDAGPSGSTTATDATFSFSSPAADATFECALDGAPWSPCSSPADYDGLTIGDHTFAVRATAGGEADPSPASRTWTIAASEPEPAGNLIANGDFEGSLSGWYGYRSKLSLVPGRSGQAAHVASSGSGSSFSIVAAPAVVASSTEGAAYAATAWVRSDVAGTTVCLRVRETSSGSFVGGALACVEASGSWQQVPTVSYTALASGDAIDVYAYLDGAAASDSFDVDDVSLRQG